MAQKEIGRIEERAIGGWKSGSSGYVYVPIGFKPKLRDPHALDIAELYIRLKECDQLELIEYRPEPQGLGLSVIPDAYVRLLLGGRPFHFYAEVEYAAKSDERVKSKLRAYERAAGRGTTGTITTLIQSLSHGYPQRTRRDRSVVSCFSLWCHAPLRSPLIAAV